MKRIVDLPLTSGSEDFKPFSEHELAMVLGGGGDEQILDFLQETGLFDEVEDLPNF